MKFSNYYNVKDGNNRHIVKMEIEGSKCQAEVVSYDKSNGKILYNQSGIVYHGEIGKFDLAKGTETINNLYIVTNDETRRAHNGFINEKYLNWRDEFSSNFCGIDIVESVDDFKKVIKDLSKKCPMPKPQSIALL